MSWHCFLRVVVLILIVFPLPAAEQWIKLTTPHFELYSAAGEKKGREAILYFEQVRSFFLENSPSKKAPEFPVRIVAFRGEKQYLPYRASESAFAYYANGRSRDYIVMQDILSDHYPAVIHEYVHLIIEHSGLKLPIWLNEGLAEVYSTLQPMGKKVSFGDIIPGRAQVLVSNPLIGLDMLTAVGHNSPLYNERNKAGMFYAESWALTHMLIFGPDYRANFSKMVAVVNSGKSAEEACQTAFGKPLWEIEVAFKKYLQGSKFYHAVVDTKLQKSEEEPDVAEASAFESGMVLADLLALNHKPDQARSSYEQLAKSNPGQPEVEESLGYLAWQADDNEGARAHFGRAIAAGTKNAQMCYHYAMLAHDGGAAKDVVPALEKAVELKPDYAEARLQLGFTLAQQHDYGRAIAQLLQLKKITPDQAPAYFSTLAYSFMQTGDLDKARQNAESAKKWAKTPAEIQQADSMLRYLDMRKNGPVVVQRSDDRPMLRRGEPRPEFAVKEAAPPANPFISKDDKMSHVDGLAQKLDCSGDTLRYSVLVEKTVMVFEIPDPDRVVIKHSGEIKHDFACGPQKGYRVAVDYAVLPDKEAGTVGIVRALEF